MAEDKADVVGFVHDYLRSRWVSTTGYALSMVTFPIGAVVVPAILGLILDKVKDKRPFAEWRHLVVYMLLAFIMVLGAYLTGIYLDSFVKTDLQNYARRRAFERIMEAYAHNFKTLQVSAIVSKVLKLPANVFDVVTDWRLYILPGAITMAAILGYFLTIDWRIAAMIGGTTAVIGGMMAVSAYVCLPGMIATDYEHDAIHERLGDTLENLMTVFLADAGDEELASIDTLQERHLHNMRRAMNCANHFTGIMKTLMGLMVAAVIYYTYVRYQGGALSSGKLVSILFVLMCSRHAIYATLWNWSSHLRNLGAMYKMQEYFEELLAHKGAGDKAQAGPRPPLPSVCSGLRFDNVSFSYPGRRSHRPALHEASFEVKRGDMVRIRGHIGSGKSTIGLLSLGLYPYDGSIQLCGREVRTLNRTELAQLISFVPQNPRLLDRTVLENLQVGLPHSREQIATLLHTLQVDFIGLDEPVGKHGSNLSTGQRATVYLVRAVLRDTPVIVCDEVTANMDAESERRVLALLKRIGRDRTMLFISHQDVDLPFTKHLVLDRGTITEHRQ
jgi:ABC-type multidrug transport system fused ATPase/permease subunit